MLFATITTVILTAGLAYALRGGSDAAGIVRRPYNNRYNDAAGAREDSAG